MAWPCFDRPCKPRTETARTREEKIFFFVFLAFAQYKKGESSMRGERQRALRRGRPAPPWAAAVLRVAVSLSILSLAACGWQWTTYIDRLFTENGRETIHECNPSLDPINATNYYFPKKGPPREKVFEPKWEQDRYRNYKQPPGTPMRHVLKPPSAPRGVVLGFDLQEGMDFARTAEVLWQAPHTNGQTNITHYLLSRDDGLSWKRVPGGGLVNSTTLKGLRRGQEVHVLVRAVNKVGPGPWVKTSAKNQARLRTRLGKQREGTLELKSPAVAQPLTAG